MRTPDGHTLHLPAEHLDALLAELRQPAVRELVRSNYQGSMRQAFARTVSLLAQGASRIGALRHRRSGERFPVYATNYGGSTFELVTRPIEGAEETIVSLRSQSDDTGAEYMAASAGRPVQYFGPMSLDAAINDPRANSPGLYRIHLPGGRLYDGRSTDTIRARLINHRWCLTHLGVPTSGYRASIGPMPRSKPARIQAAEKRAIRQTRRQSPGAGTNVREGEFEAMFRDYREAESAIQYETPPRGRRGGRGRRPLLRSLACSPTDLSTVQGIVGRPVTVDDIRAAIERAVERGVSSAQNAARALRQSPRQANTLRAFQEAFGVTPETVPRWRNSSDRWKDLGELVAQRLESAARILGGGSIRYYCWTCPYPGWNPRTMRAGAPSNGRYEICLGQPFFESWRDRMYSLMAGSLLHEALHIYFPRTVEHEKRVGNSHCFQVFVALYNRHPLYRCKREQCLKVPCRA
ncbi:MAG TPA: hypothetical protein VGB73_08485 [Pyrinomonadaceae bacterium]|jgi:hypothetical protein